MTFAIGAILLVLLTWAGMPSVLIHAATAVMGIGYVGQQVFAIALLADCIADETRHTGQAQGGVLLGIGVAPAVLMLVGLAFMSWYRPAGAPERSRRALSASRGDAGLGQANRSCIRRRPSRRASSPSAYDMRR